MPGPEYRLAAILSADIAGYSRLMAEDEDATIQAVIARREEVELHIRQHRGRLVDFTGDNFLAEFGSAVDAVECAVEIQRLIAAMNADLPPERKMTFRIGLHLGEVQARDGRLFGTGVNVAARLEGIGEPGGVCISEEVHREVSGRTRFEFRDLGARELKNIPEPVHAYAVELPEVPPAADPSRPIGWVAAGIIGLVALAALGWWVLRGGSFGLPAERTPVTSLLVLPFDDMSPDGDQEYFAHGMSEELTNVLTSLSDLRVIGRTSAEVVKKRGLTVAEIASELDVGAVVEGSVRRSGDRVRITVQLIAAQDGFQLWSDAFDRPVGDVFAIQREIAAAVAAALRARLVAAASSAPTSSLDAYDAYLTGRHLLHRQTAKDMRLAIEHFESAIRIDGRFALAYSGLADALGVSWTNGFETGEDIVSRAARAAAEAVRADDGSAEAHTSLGRARWMEWEWASAEAELRRGLELNPGYAFARVNLAAVLLHRGFVEDGLDELNRAMDLDPLSPFVNANLANAHLVLGEFEQAIRIARKTSELEPRHQGSRLIAAGSYTELGRDRKALDALLGLDLPLDLERVFESGGIRAVWKSLLDAQIARSKDRCPVPAGASIYGLLGDREMALFCLEKGVRQGGINATLYVTHNKNFDFLRDDPRFQAILEGMNLSD